MKSRKWQILLWALEILNNKQYTGISGSLEYAPLRTHVPHLNRADNIHHLFSAKNCQALERKLCKHVYVCVCVCIYIINYSLRIKFFLQTKSDKTFLYTSKYILKWIHDSYIKNFFLLLFNKGASQFEYLCILFYVVL